MNRWARIVWSLGLAATLGWIGAGAFGYRVVDQASLGLHTLASFAALLALLLAHGWMRCSHSLRATRGAGCRACRQGSLPRCGTFLAGVLAIVVASAQFSVSNALFPSRLAAARTPPRGRVDRRAGRGARGPGARSGGARSRVAELVALRARV